MRPIRRMAAASETVSTSGRVASALVAELVRSSGAVGEVGAWAYGWSPGSRVGVHCCSWTRGAGVEPYLDPASRGGVFSLVGGLIVRLSAAEVKERERAPGCSRGVGLSVNLAERGARGDQDRERACVVLGDVDSGLGRSPGRWPMPAPRRLDGAGMSLASACPTQPWGWLRVWMRSSHPYNLGRAFQSGTPERQRR